MDLVLCLCFVKMRGRRRLLELGLHGQRWQKIAAGELLIRDIWTSSWIWVMLCFLYTVIFLLENGSVIYERYCKVEACCGGDITERRINRYI